MGVFPTAKLWADTFQEVREVRVPRAGEWESGGWGCKSCPCPLWCGRISSVVHTVISGDSPSLVQCWGKPVSPASCIWAKAPRRFDCPELFDCSRQHWHCTPSSALTWSSLLPFIPHLLVFSATGVFLCSFGTFSPQHSKFILLACRTGPEWLQPSACDILRLHFSFHFLFPSEDWLKNT